MLQFTLTLVLASWNEPGKFHPLTLPCTPSLQRQENVQLPVVSQPFPYSRAWKVLYPQIPENPSSVSRYYYLLLLLLPSDWKFTIKVATFLSHELTCPGMSWLSSFSAFWFKCSLPVFIPGHTTPPGTVFVAFAQLLTQVAEDMEDSGRRSARFRPEEMAPMALHFWDLKQPTPPLPWKVP